MGERGIIFTAPMVRAILGGRKTQTRRVVKHEYPLYGAPKSWPAYDCEEGFGFESEDEFVRCPYGNPPERLWVRENWTLLDHNHKPVNTSLKGLHSLPVGYDVVFQADHINPKGDGPDKMKWKPSIHMHRWASRITLEITDIRVERLQDISEDDADAEGFGGDFPHRVFPDIFYRDMGHLSIPECFGILWDSINGKKPGCSWDENPWVWVIEFKRLEGRR